MPALAPPPPLRLLSPLPPPQSTVRPTDPSREEPLSVSDTSQIYDLLTKMDGKLDDMRGDLATVDKAQALQLAWQTTHETVTTPDQERRLRVLEGDRHKIYGIAIALGAAAGIAHVAAWRATQGSLRPG